LRRRLWLLAFAALAHCKRQEPEPAPARATDIGPPGNRTEPRPAASPASGAATGPAGSTVVASASRQSGLNDAGGPTADARRAGSIRFAVIGDYGAETAGEAAVAAMVKGWRPDFVITLGDNNYPTGEASTIDANIGRFYVDFIGNYRGRFGSGSAENRFWPSPGNHDWISGLGPYLAYFTLPGNERYYDVDHGLVHLYALDSDPREPDGIDVESQQAAWLKQRLHASKSCYDVVYFHHPSYSTSEHGSTLPMRWPFRAWGAEVVMAGHDHTYERFAVDGIPYFVNGLGGASKYDFPGTALPETKFRYNEEYGAMLVTATTTAIAYEFFTIDGKKRDTFSVPGNCQ
jgi:hypothetical protein